VSLRGVLRIAGDDTLLFWCPGCEQMHAVGAAAWQFNGDYDHPSLSPSILVTSGHYAPGWRGPGCWCSYNYDHPGETNFKCFRCHSFVKGGKVEFLSDSTHKLAGKTVPLEVPPV
jgi:hypothetical protein